MKDIGWLDKDEKEPVSKQNEQQNATKKPNKQATFKAKAKSNPIPASFTPFDYNTASSSTPTTESQVPQSQPFDPYRKAPMTVSFLL
jgi:hypothetical protein